MQHFLDGIKNYTNFKDRATRQQYWMYYLFYIIFYFIAMALDVSIGTFSETYGAGIITTVFSLGLFIPSIAILVRRLHDINKTGWWALLLIIPLVGPLIILVFTLLDSHQGDNQYGKSIKYPETETSQSTPDNVNNV